MASAPRPIIATPFARSRVWVIACPLEACPLQFMISLTCIVAYLPCGDRLRSAGALENAFALVRAAPYPFEPQLSRTVAARTPLRNIKRGADPNGWAIALSLRLISSREAPTPPDTP